LCLAYGKTCCRCKGRNHFESVCLSKKPAKPTARHEVHQLDVEDDDDDKDDANVTRARQGAMAQPFRGRQDKDSISPGATVNLIPESTIYAMGRLKDVRPTTANLRMFDGIALQTSGTITLAVRHPISKTTY